MPKKQTAKAKVMEAETSGYKKALIIKKTIISRKKKSAKAKVSEIELIKALLDSWKKQAEVTPADPFGSGFAALASGAFQEAVAAVWKRQKQQQQDSYGTIDGELVAVKPDGRVEPVIFTVTDKKS